MPYTDLIDLLEYVGKDPSRLIFEDELTGLHNRRFLFSYLEHKVDWRSDQDLPVSLLILDLDRFKEINDTYGHDTGDQALIWMAALIKDVVGDHGLPIRFGGDEFIVLLPKSGRGEAREAADRIRQRVRDRPFRLRDTPISVPIQVSIGFATAPENAANSRDLFELADTALLHAKRSGRDQVAGAAEIDPEKVHSKTALYRLKATGIAGRDEEMGIVSGALQDLSAGRSQFLIFEAGPGMGKTTFIETVQQNLAGDDTFCTIKVVGDQKEAYRPYYLASRILLAVLNQREDKGAEILEGLNADEIAHLGKILPQLGDTEAPPSEATDSTNRQALFAALARLLPRAVDFRPLVLIVDDLQLADEATLLLLRVLIKRQQLPVLVCGSAMEALKLRGEEEASPLERFYSIQQEELGIRRQKLRPLSRDHIGEYLKGVFPSLRTPDDFVDELARITQGNPLFLGEVIRKLVNDGKVSLIGQQWVIDALEEGYLPRSLEEIVIEKIAALDEESRELLERATALGEDIPVSVLAGSSDLDENKVLEFLDRAEALGLVSLDFQINDEVMRFLGKRVLEISYGEIAEERREELHEEVGAYQEHLYEQRLLPSASLLAYHFKRSANQDKARRYEQIQLAFSQSVFNADEATTYTEELIEVEDDTEVRLEPESIQHVPQTLRTLVSAARNIQLYPTDSGRIKQSLADVKAAVDRILEKNEKLELSQSQRALLANSQRLDTTRFSLLAKSFLELLTRCELQSLIFLRGVTEAELKTLLATLGKLKPEAIHRSFWREFIAEKGLLYIGVQQVRYSRLRRKRIHASVREPLAEERELEPAQLAKVPKVLRALQAAAQKAKLYPIDSKPVTGSLEQLHQSLQGLFNGNASVTLASADQALLVNGNRVDTSGYAPLAAGVLELMRAIGLNSVTFISNMPFNELVAFADALRNPPAPGFEREFWDEFADKRGLACLAFNQRQYALGMVQHLLDSVEVVIDDEPAEAEVDGTAEWAEQMLDAPSEEVLRDALQRFGKELLVKGEHDVLRRLLRQLFADFRERDVHSRELAIMGCRNLLDSLILGLQHKFAELALDSFLGAVAGEEDPRVLQELGSSLHNMASCGLYFADYQMASRILLEIKDRQQQLEKGGREGEGLAKLLDRRLEPAAQELLKDDLKSGQTERHQRAAQVLGSLGRPGIPLLVAVIKEEKDFRVRQMAANLLAELGSEAADQLKHALGTEVTVEQRFRVLEVIDTVTRDLRSELVYCLGDSSAKIRRAAFRLFERLHDDEQIDLILPLARDPDPAVAKGAIRSLAHLRSKAAVTALVSILNETKNATVATACCQGLGQVRHASSIDALAKVLARWRIPFLVRRWDEQVRATAAMALKQITHPRAQEVLSHYATDRATRVRQLAGAPAKAS